MGKLKPQGHSPLRALTSLKGISFLLDLPDTQGQRPL